MLLSILTSSSSAMRTFTLALTSLLLLASSVSAQIADQPRTYILHHRLIPSSSNSAPSSDPNGIPPLRPYGTIRLTNASTIPSTPAGGSTSSSSSRSRPEDAMVVMGSFREIARSERSLFDATFSTEAASGEEVGNGMQGWWYQVALEDPEDHGGEESWVLASTKACYLPHTPLQITLSIPSSPSPSHPLPISVHIQPSSDIPQDGSCPATAKSSTKVAATAASVWPRGLEVVVKRPARAFSPAPLSPLPVTLTADGQPVAPPVEKSFLQKYWLPLLGVGFFLLSQLGPDKPSGNGAASS